MYMLHIILPTLNTSHTPTMHWSSGWSRLVLQRQVHGALREAGPARLLCRAAPGLPHPLHGRRGLRERHGDVGGVGQWDGEDRLGPGQVQKDPGAGRAQLPGPELGRSAVRAGELERTRRAVRLAQLAGANELLLLPADRPAAQCRRHNHSVKKKPKKRKKSHLVSLATVWSFGGEEVRRRVNFWRVNSQQLLFNLLHPSQSGQANGANVFRRNWSKKEITEVLILVFPMCLYTNHRCSFQKFTHLRLKAANRLVVKRQNVKRSTRSRNHSGVSHSDSRSPKHFSPGSCCVVKVSSRCRSHLFFLRQNFFPNLLENIPTFWSFTVWTNSTQAQWKPVFSNYLLLWNSRMVTWFVWMAAENNVSMLLFAPHLFSTSLQ